eukprot:s80_g18.t1
MAEASRSYEMGSPTRENDRSVLLQEEQPVQDPPPVKSLLLAFLIMFQGYGVMNGNPQHALKMKLDLAPDQAGAFQDATASFQLSKLLMRVLQISLLVFMQPNGIVYLSYVVMFVAVLVPVFLVWCADMTDLSVVYLQYTLGGIAIGLFEGTFLSVISVLGKNTKTFAIMGAPLGFAVHNILLGTFQQWGMPVVVYYVYSAICLPFAMAIFYYKAPPAEANSQGKGCQASLSTFLSSLLVSIIWAQPDAFPLLFNTFNTARVPIFGPDSTSPTIPFQYYTAWYWFVLMALGDTLSRRVPQYLSLSSWQSWACWIVVSIILCIGGEALNFLLLAIVTGIAAFLAYFGNGPRAAHERLIYGLSAKYIDAYIPPQHRYTAYNLWCFCGDLGGYAGQSSLSVHIAKQVCEGRHYTYVCHQKAFSWDTAREWLPMDWPSRFF